MWLRRPGETVEMSVFLGERTNNFAELSAIELALKELSDEERNGVVHLYTDSAWSIGVLVQNWKAKTNLQIIAKIKELISAVPKLEIIKVKGHSGDEGNEMADHLATRAVRREASDERRRKRS